MKKWGGGVRRGLQTIYLHEKFLYPSSEKFGTGQRWNSQKKRRV